MRVPFAAVAWVMATLGPWFTPAAAAQSCTRPTDAGGAHGYVYGAAAVTSFGTARVLVWYVTTGQHAVRAATSRDDGVPDDVADVAQVTTDALASYAAMGYRAPIADDINPDCGSNGGDDRIDIYLVHMVGADGTTVVESDRCDVVGNAVPCASYILARADFTGAYPSTGVGIRTVLPHETFHAVQNAYDVDIDRFWAEGTAQWAAARLDPSLTDLERFLPAFFSQTARSLDAPPNGVTSAYLYGAAIWPVFLTQRYGDGIVRAIFNAEADYGVAALAATDVVLAADQSSLAREYPLFSAWNAGAGTVLAVGGYTAGARYPMAMTAPLPRDGRVQGITSGLSSFSYRARFAGRSIVALSTDAERNAGMLVPIVDGLSRIDQIAALPAGVDVVLAGDAILVVTGITTNKTDAPFTIAVTVHDTDAGASDSASSEADVGQDAVAATDGTIGTDGRVSSDGSTSATRTAAPSRAGAGCSCSAASRGTGGSTAGLLLVALAGGLALARPEKRCVSSPPNARAYASETHP